MPTSVHIPKPLLDEVDKRARALKISRNRFIVRALQKELEQRDSWTPGFLERLQETDEELRRAVGEMTAVVHTTRRSKGPPRL
jgi:metal-responsive CopG/Arc/MetJ family transcriptional regulator